MQGELHGVSPSTAFIVCLSIALFVSSGLLSSVLAKTLPMSPNNSAVYATFGTELLRRTDIDAMVAGALLSVAFYHIIPVALVHLQVHLSLQGIGEDGALKVALTSLFFGFLFLLLVEHVILAPASSALYEFGDGGAKSQATATALRRRRNRRTRRSVRAALSVAAATMYTDQVEPFDVSHNMEYTYDDDDDDDHDDNDDDDQDQEDDDAELAEDHEREKDDLQHRVNEFIRQNPDIVNQANAEREAKKWLERSLLAALSLHSLSAGINATIGDQSSLQYSFLFFSQLTHKLIDTSIVYEPIKNVCRSRAQRTAVFLLYALLTPLGLFVGHVGATQRIHSGALDYSPPLVIMSMFQMAAAGILMYISLVVLVPGQFFTASEKKWRTLWCFIVAYAFTAILSCGGA